MRESEADQGREKKQKAITARHAAVAQVHASSSCHCTVPIHLIRIRMSSARFFLFSFSFFGANWAMHYEKHCTTQKLIFGLTQLFRPRPLGQRQTRAAKWGEDCLSFRRGTRYANADTHQGTKNARLPASGSLLCLPKGSQGQHQGWICRGPANWGIWHAVGNLALQ